MIGCRIIAENEQPEEAGANPFAIIVDSLQRQCLGQKAQRFGCLVCMPCTLIAPDGRDPVCQVAKGWIVKPKLKAKLPQYLSADVTRLPRDFLGLVNYRCRLQR